MRIKLEYYIDLSDKFPGDLPKVEICRLILGEFGSHVYIYDKPESYLDRGFEAMEDTLVMKLLLHNVALEEDES